MKKSAGELVGQSVGLLATGNETCFSSSTTFLPNTGSNTDALSVCRPMYKETISSVSTRQQYSLDTGLGHLIRDAPAERKIFEYVSTNFGLFQEPFYFNSSSSFKAVRPFY